MERITSILCAALSGALFYAATGFGGTISTTPGGLWALAFLAPIPVLWLAFRPGKGWVAFLAALFAGAIGGCNILPAYLGALPTGLLVAGIIVPGLLLAISVAAARFVAQRVSPISGVVVFAALWAALDYLSSLGTPGAALSPGYSQLDLPWNVQIASLFGIWAITCVIGLFAVSAAMFAATRQKQFVILAVAVFALNAGYGAWRIATAPQTPAVHVGLAADDSLIRDGMKNDEAAALNVVKAYAEAAQSLALKEATLIVFPEKIAVLSPPWRGAAKAELITAAHIGHATIVAGFDQRDATRLNNALIYFANGTTPAAYTKRRLVPGLESAFTPGHASFMLGDRTAVAICKDMDSPSMIRSDSMVGPDVFAVPAWDFERDAIWHARLAIMRGVENGFAVVRAANDGLLTISDAYGRVVAIRRSNEAGMVLLDGMVARGPGRTVYTGIGDGFAWVAGALSVLLLVVAFLAGYRKESPVV